MLSFNYSMPIQCFSFFSMWLDARKDTQSEKSACSVLHSKLSGSRPTPSRGKLWRVKWKHTHIHGLLKPLNLWKSAPEAIAETCSVEKVFLKILQNFAKKHLWGRASLNKVATLLKKRLSCKCFPVNFTKFLRTPTLKNTSRRLLLTIVGQSYESLVSHF